ncbi:hypothetical protein BDF21DRAFT_406390 [Thamnidium elegans]|nr:hypothetical protein BDF21DRAFT_406390 [Thamnidium elegans]
MGPYGCGVMNCFASFSASNGLFYHMKNVHPNIEEIYKPYRCAMPTCPKRYKNINGLQYHLREAKGSSGHGGLSGQDGEQLNVKPYTCQIPGCKKAYRTANGLRYHQVHGHNIQPHPLMEANTSLHPMQPPPHLMHLQARGAPQGQRQAPSAGHPHQVQQQQQSTGHPLQAVAHPLQAQTQAQVQQQQSLPQFRMQREKWLMNNNI